MTEKTELIRRAYVEACIFYPVPTYAMEQAARYVNPEANPVSWEEIQDVYTCPIQYVETARRRGWLKDGPSENDMIRLGILQQAERESFEELRAIDYSKEPGFQSGKSRDERLAAFADRMAAYDHWRGVLTDIGDELARTERIMDPERWAEREARRKEKEQRKIERREAQEKERKARERAARKAMKSALY